MDLATSKYGHLKYTLKLADFVALGASLTGDITLDTLPAGAILLGWSIKPPAIFAGPSLSAATLQMKLNSTLKGSTVNVFANANGAVDPTVATDVMTTTTAVKIAVSLTGCNANALTAAQADVILNYTVLSA